MTGVEVNVSAAHGQDRVHQSQVLVCEVQDDVFEGILGLAFHCEHIAEVVDVMLPKDLILNSLNTMEQGMKRDAWETLLSKAL